MVMNNLIILHRKLNVYFNFLMIVESKDIAFKKVHCIWALRLWQVKIYL